MAHAHVSNARTDPPGQKTKQMIKRGGVQMKCWDIGGQAQYRGEWGRYTRGCDVIVYVVDAHAEEKVKTRQNEKNVSGFQEPVFLPLTSAKDGRLLLSRTGSIFRGCVCFLKTSLARVGRVLVPLLLERLVGDDWLHGSDWAKQVSSMLLDQA